MNEWVKLMLEEVRRKAREREQASREHQRRNPGPSGDKTDPPGRPRPAAPARRD